MDQSQIRNNNREDRSEDKENSMNNSNLSFRSSRYESIGLESKQLIEEPKESNLNSSIVESKYNSEDLKNSKVSDELTEYEKDQAHLNSYLCFDQLQQYTQQGEEAKRLAQQKDAIILMGPTGSGKTTFLHFIKGCEMVEKQIEVLTKEGEKTIKKVIISNDEIKNAKIGYGTVSVTQFLNVIDLDNRTVIIDTPGFKDNRSLEVDISNNINVMNVLKVCKTVRIVLLINYHDFMSDRAGPFRETALIAAKMLNNNDFFEKNLQSVSVFYTHGQEAEIADIKDKVYDVENDLNECGKFDNRDRQVLGTFLNKLNQLLKDKDSCILNPLDLSQQEKILENIQSKPPITQPNQRLSQFSFCQETESRIQIYCSQLKDKVENYQKKYQFKEMFQLLDIFQKLQNLIKLQQIQDMYSDCLNQVEKKFKEELDNNITVVIDSLKSGNTIVGRQSEQLKKLKQSLCLWNQEKGTHSFEQDLYEDYLEVQIKQKFQTIFDEALNNETAFDLLIQMLQSVQSIQDVINESKQLIDQIKKELKKGIEIQNEKDYEIIQKEINSQPQNGSSRNQNMQYNINRSLKRVNKQNEILLQNQFEDLANLKNDFVDKIYNCLLKGEIENLQSFFNGLLQDNPQTSSIDILTEQQLSEAIEKLEKNRNLHQIINYFANSMFYENCEVFMNKREALEAIINDQFCKYIKVLTDDFLKKKLQSKYFKLIFVQFISKYQQLFCLCKDQSLRSLMQFYDVIKQVVNELDNKMKSSFNKIKQNYLQVEILNFSKLANNFQKMKSITWIQDFISGCSIEYNLDYFEEKNSKFFSKLTNQIQELFNQVQKIHDTQEIDQQFKNFQAIFNCLYNLNDKFQTLTPQIKDLFQNFMEKLLNSFKKMEQCYDEVIQQLKEGKNINKDLLFKIEKTLIIIKYTPVNLIDHLKISEKQLVELFDNLFQESLKNMPNSNQWQLLLDKDKQYFVSWNELLDRIEKITSYKNKLSILLEKSLFSSQLTDIQKIQNQIISLYNNLIVKINYFSQNKEIIEAEKAYKTIINMYESLSNLNLTHIAPLNLTIKQDIKCLLDDLDSSETLSKFKQNKQYILDLRKIKDNLQQYEKLFESLKQNITKQIKHFLSEIKNKNFDVTHSQNKIQDIMEWRELLKELIEKEQREKFEEEFQNQFEKEFNQWIDNNLAKFNIMEDQNNEVKKILKWYDDITNFLSQQGFQKKQFMDLNQIFIQNVQKTVNNFLQDKITNWQSQKFNKLFVLISELNGYLNFFQSGYCETVQNQQNQLKKFIDDEIKSQLDNFSNLIQQDPVDVSQCNQIIKVFNHLDKYDLIYDGQRILIIINDLNTKLENQINEQLNYVLCYIQKIEIQSEKEAPKVKEYLSKLKINDHKSFQCAMKEIDKMFEMIKKSLNQIYTTQNIQIRQILDYIKQIYVLHNLQNAKLTQDIQHPIEIKNIIGFFKEFLFEFQKQIKNKENITYQDFNNFCDLLKSVELLKEYQNPDINEFDSQIQQIQEKLYQEVNQCISNLQTSYNQNNYVKINNSIHQLKKIEDVIQFIKGLQIKSQQKIPTFIYNKLWEFILKSSYSNIQEAEYQLNQVIQNCQTTHLQHWKEKEFQKFIQHLKNLKELGNENNKIYKDIYKETIIEYNKNIESISQEAQQLIQKNKWNKQLNTYLEDLERLNEVLTNTDLSEIIKQEFKKVENLIDSKLNLNLNRNKFQENVDILIEIRKISDEVPFLHQKVLNKINELISQILIQAPKENIMRLSNILQNHQNPVAMSILKECQQFKNIDLQILKEKYYNFDNFNYLNTKLQYSNMKDLNKYEQISSQQSTQLKKHYDIFLIKFNKTRIEYIQNLKQINQIVDDVYNKLNQNFDLNNWNSKMINECNEILALICAYWALSYMRKNCQQELYDQVIQLYASQVISIMILLGFDENKAQKLQNQLLQVSTGEGKSIILGILSTLIALMGYQVDLACYSQILSDRDYQSFKDLFIAFRVDDKIKYGTFIKICSDKINQKGDIRLLSKQLLNNNLQKQDYKSQEKCILIIDEVDVFFNQSFYGQTYNPCCLFQNSHITKILSAIWADRSLDQQTIYQNIINSQSFKELNQQFPQMKIIFLSHIILMIQDVKNIDSHQDYKYDKEQGKIGYKYFDDYNYDLNQGYSTIFAYFQEMQNDNITKEQAKKHCGINLSCGQYSYSNLPLPPQYQNILGVTGTLQTLGDKYLDILKNYIQKTFIIPSIFGESKLQFEKKNLEISYTKDDFYKNIMNISKLFLQEQQPVIIFFKDNQELEEFQYSNYMEDYRETVLLLNQQQKYKDYVIQKSCRQGQLTLCDKAFGRGTDFICQNTYINKQGGLVILQTFFSEEISEEFQIKGRTARQGNQGIFIQHLFYQDLLQTFGVSEKQLKKHENDIYSFLNEQRNLLSQKNVKQMIVSSHQKQFYHEKTLNYQKYLLQNKKEEALNMLITFNQQALSFQNLHFILLLDDSSSMKELDGTDKSRWQKLISAIESFINERSKQISYDQDIISVVYYSGDSKIVAQYQHLKLALSTINNQKPRFMQTTKFYLAINECINILQNEKPEHQQMKKVILFLSDGEDGYFQSQNLTSSLQNLKQLYKEKILAFWNIGFGPNADKSVLLTMAQIMQECGGKFSQAINLNELYQKFQDLAQIGKIMNMV